VGSLGLTRPRRTKSKYRLYSAEDVTLLKRARFLRKVRGLNAPAIVELLKREGRLQPAPDGNSGAIGGHLRQLRMKRKLSLARVARAAGYRWDFERSGAVPDERFRRNSAQAGALLQNQYS